MQEVYTVAEVASILKVSTDLVRVLEKRGLLVPDIRVSQKVKRYTANNIANFIESSKRQ
jgi:DNA-binding transcriptional MerR regulator